MYQYNVILFVSHIQDLKAFVDLQTISTCNNLCPTVGWMRRFQVHQFPKNEMTTLLTNVEVECETGEIWPQIGY